MTVAEQIRQLATERGAVILAHNYQRGEVQDCADFVGDSLQLAREAAATDARIIVFCGVRFMAETAKILSPDKTVLLPREEADCPMANMVSVEQLMRFKQKHPDAMVVSYVNTNADVKAESDVCCTSANAVTVVQNVETKKVIFVPDENLAAYCQQFVDKQIIAWPGYCYVHSQIERSEVLAARQQHPDAVLIVHPECPPEVTAVADEVLSTGGMVRFARESNAKRFLIGTEEGLIHRLRKENPDKEFHPAGAARVCYNMKFTTLEDVRQALLEEKHEIRLPAKIMARAEQALQRMLEYV